MTGTLVLVCNTLARSTRLHKIGIKIGQRIECEAVKPYKVAAWITHHASSGYGKRVSAASAARLRALAGDSLGELDAELSKLSVYVGDRPAIEPGDIDDLVGNHREENVFALLDAVADRNAPAALERWQQVVATDRAVAGRAVAGLAWGVRRWVETSRARESGEPIGALAGIGHC